MKNLIALLTILLIAGCETTAPITFVGDGSYQKLQEDRYECANESSNRVSVVSGSSSEVTVNAVRIGSSKLMIDCSLFRACLAARGWKLVDDGSGTPVATVIHCYQ